MIAREGLPFVLTSLAVTVLSAVPAMIFPTLWLSVPATIAALVTLCFLAFFRDPPRRTAAEADALLAPADGRVVDVERLPDHPHIGGACLRLSIFLSLFDVHINRTPAAGMVDYVTYRPGRFLAAYRRKASELNERTEIGMTLADGSRVVVKQIAGCIARRVVCRLRQGDGVPAGGKFGMIRFGSRTDLLVPAACRLRVARGDHVKAGLTVVGTLPSGPSNLSDGLQRENVEL